MKASDVDRSNAVFEANSQSTDDKVDINVSKNGTPSDSQDALTSTERKKFERYARRKAKHEQKKEEKRLQREEDFFKKRMSSKDQKVTLIEKSVLEKLLANEPANMNHKVGCTESNFFPELGAKVHINKVSVRSNEVANSSVNNSSPSPVNQQTNIALSVGNNVDGEKHPEKTVKRPKRRDLIQINLSQIIKTQDTHPTELSIKSSEVAKKKPEAIRYSGNILDSDNPERKRGKQRETPKAKKPSRLKAAILYDRQQRQQKNALLTEQSLEKVDTAHNCENPSMCEPVSPSTERSETILKSNVDDSYSQPQDMHQSQRCPSWEESRETSVNNNTNRLGECCYTTPSPDPGLPDHAVPHLKQESDAPEFLTVSQQINESHIQDTHSRDPVPESDPSETGIAGLINCEVKASSSAPKAQLEERSSCDIHNRKFREYCDHMLTPELTKVVSQLLEDIVKFHDRQYARNPLKASARRRHITGLKEVKRYTALRKLKLVVIAPDLEKAPSQGGLDDTVRQIKEQARAAGVPCVFALGRRRLGFLLRKKVPVSCVGILNYDGTETNYKDVLSHLEVARKLYQDLTGTGKKQESRATDSEANNSSDNVSAQALPEPKPEEVPNVNKAVVASLLAKLTEPSPPLRSIEPNKDFDSDDSGEF